MRYWIGGLIFCIIVFVVIPLAWWQFRVETSDIKGRGEVTMTVNSSGNRMQRYAYFFDLCNSVRSAEEAIDRQTSTLETTNDEREKNRIQQNINANFQARINGVLQYNAESVKYTSEQFKDSQLPTRLSELYVAGGTKTQCVV